MVQFAQGNNIPNDCLECAVPWIDRWLLTYAVPQGNDIMIGSDGTYDAVNNRYAGTVVTNYKRIVLTMTPNTVLTSVYYIDEWLAGEIGSGADKSRLLVNGNLVFEHNNENASAGEIISYNNGGIPFWCETLEFNCDVRDAVPPDGNCYIRIKQIQLTGNGFNPYEYALHIP
jgi:hypothetical protein